MQEQQSETIYRIHPSWQQPKRRLRDLASDTPVTVAAMADARGIDRGTVYARLRRGRTLTEALSNPFELRQPVSMEPDDSGWDAWYRRYRPPSAGRTGRFRARSTATLPVGHLKLGPSRLCRMYGIPRSLYGRRIARGWTMHEALLTPVHKEWSKKKQEAHA